MSDQTTAAGTTDSSTALALVAPQPVAQVTDQQAMAQAQQVFLSQFVAILDTDQLQKLQAVRIAAQLQPILPAFQPIFLF